MSLHTMDCSALNTLDTAPAPACSPVDLTRMRYDRIVRARREILEGRYDNATEVDRMLDACMDHIALDISER